MNNLYRGPYLDENYVDYYWRDNESRKELAERIQKQITYKNKKKRNKNV